MCRTAYTCTMYRWGRGYCIHQSWSIMWRTTYTCTLYRWWWGYCIHLIVAGELRRAGGRVERLVGNHADPAARQADTLRKETKAKLWDHLAGNVCCCCLQLKATSCFSVLVVHCISFMSTEEVNERLEISINYTV